jgi:putative sigma-54 modulation protein
MMRIETYGQQLEVTPALRQYVEEKLRRLDRHFEQAIEVRVQLGLRKPSHHAAADLSVPGKTLHADADGENMYAAIDLLADKLNRLILKHKEKISDHQAPRVVPDAG